MPSQTLAPTVQPPVFICGYPRSGTTLLASLLDGHPELIVFPEELGFFRFVYQRRNRLDAILNDSGLANLRPGHCSTKKPHTYTGVDYARIEAGIKHLVATMPTERQLLVGLVSVWIANCGTHSGRECRWVEKTPKTERWAPLLLDWFGRQTVFIHLVRDPRDTFDTYRRWHPDISLLQFACRWSYSAALGVRHAARLPNYHLVRYEDLVENPSPIMNSIATWLGIAWQPSLLAPTRTSRAWRGNSSDDITFTGI